MQKYKTLKFITIALQVFNVPFGVYAGAMLALGDGKMFVLGLAVSMGFVLLQSYLWWLTMERLNENQKTSDKLAKTRMEDLIGSTLSEEKA